MNMSFENLLSHSVRTDNHHKICLTVENRILYPISQQLRKQVRWIALPSLTLWGSEASIQMHAARSAVMGHMTRVQP
jgi:hypothetical protein